MQGIYLARDVVSYLFHLRASSIIHTILPNLLSATYPLSPATCPTSRHACASPCCRHWRRQTRRGQGALARSTLTLCVRSITARSRTFPPTLFSGNGQQGAKSCVLSQRTMRWGDSRPSGVTLAYFLLLPCSLAPAAHQEGGHHRQVRCPVWCLAAQAGEEDGGESALEVHMRFLRKGQCQAFGRGHLEVLQLQEGCGGRRVHSRDGAGGAGTCLMGGHTSVSPFPL